jgi:hypothetical protein
MHQQVKDKVDNLEDNLSSELGTKPNLPVAAMPIINTPQQAAPATIADPFKQSEFFDVPGFQKKSISQVEPPLFKELPKKMTQIEVLSPILAEKPILDKSTDAEVEEMLDKEHKKQGFTDEYQGWISDRDITKASKETDAEMFADDVEER